MMTRFGLLVAVTLAIFTAPAGAITTIDNTGGPDPSGGITGFGTTQSVTFGQTFTVGADSVLDNYSLFIGYGDRPFSFKSYIYAWDGTRPLGPALYTSSLATYGSGEKEEFAFSTGGLSLTSGQKYVAVLSTLGLSNGAFMNVPYGTEIPDSEFVALLRFDSDPVALTEGDWQGTTFDTYLRASLSAAPSSGAVPEPTTWALMVGGFGVIGAALRHRRKAAVCFG